ncbi:MAG: hemerythrin domain-containing protein [Candidatus Cloacimonetes bacterium]|nr:hemerythrin domain-containing protein [Candidatus Cloacimonadota bacterium]
MIEVSAKLMEEHQLILKFIGLSMSYVDNANDALLLEKAPLFVNFIKEYADGYHHAKEEDILFTSLGEPGVLTHCNPIGQMLHEHDMGRELVAKMVKGYEASDVAILKEGLQSYGLLLRDHIFKEDNILYPMAENSLDQDSKQKVNDQYQKVETDMGGLELTKKYQDLYTELEQAMAQEA